MTVDYLYRYEDHTYASMEDDFGHFSTDTRLLGLSFPVQRETPCGYWIIRGVMGSKWVSKTSKKRFAYPTTDEAWHAFRKRKERCISILKERLKRAQYAYNLPKPVNPVPPFEYPHTMI